MKTKDTVVFLHQLIIPLLLLRPVVAPVPRCSPFIIINKVPESMSLTSDMNPYFPVPPCEYGGPLQALLAGDYESVFILAHPERVPLHNLYELAWIVKTGYARLERMLAGEEEFVFDSDIITEGYSHNTEQTRTEQLGHGTHRDTGAIDFRYRESIQKLLAQERRRRKK